MAGIKIISASAGSGKTYRLAQEIFQEIASGRVRSEGLVATTFTNKAAAELQERVRRRLLSEGLISEAQRLAAARMGTVHSVCGSLLGDFAFDIGSFSEISILDEEQCHLQLSRSLSTALSDKARNELAGIQRRFGEFDWMAAVRDLVEAARVNGLGTADLADCRKRSVKSCLAHFGKPTKDGIALEKRLANELKSFLNNVNTADDTTKATQKVIDAVKQALSVINSGQSLTWANWVKLGALKAAKKSNPLLDGVREAGQAHDIHPGLQHDMKMAIELVFNLAIQGLDAYQKYKRERGAMDFADQESLALDLLNQPYVRERLSQELDLLLVDEFQDTSPIQLAIFLRLAEVCGRAVWVGDQKQSIYAFRGTDPALMDECLTKISGADNVETLNKSWRSRPALVRLSSEVFAKAFSTHGIPPDMVRLEPAKTRSKQNESALGPVVERWILGSGDRLQSKATQAEALAAGIAQLLTDNTVMVRDRIDNRPRQARPGDVGILCRQNAVCWDMAKLLKEHGIQAQVSRPGLMFTPEALLVLAGLRLWVDPKDALAASELARIIHYSDRPDDWISDLLKAGSAECFRTLPEAVELAKLSSDNPTAGPVLAMDLIMEALGARERCLAWGESEARLANLEALRGHCHAYAASARAEGAGATSAGLIDYLTQLQAAEEDNQGMDPGRDAVNVSTWHSAKGLEWPITVLHQLDKTYDTSIDGVVVMGRENGFDIADPLAGRWVRYWPYPYGRNKNNIPFCERVEQSDDYRNRDERERKQDLRLLYMGWTRARDRLILAGPPEKINEGLLALLNDGGRQLLTEPNDDKINWAGVELDCPVRKLEPAGVVSAATQPGMDYRPSGPAPYPPARLRPSDMEGSAEAKEQYRIGNRMTIKNDPEPVLLGEVLHSFFAADRQDYDKEQRLELACDVLARWGLTGKMDPGEMVVATDNLMAWISEKFSGAELDREWPMSRRLAEGSILTGFADLVIETKDGFAVVDHKSFPGRNSDAVEYARGFAGQLKVYAESVAKATNKKCLGSYIHLPIVGLMVSLAD